MARQGTVIAVGGLSLALFLAAVLSSSGQEGDGAVQDMAEPPRGPFGYSMLSTASGAPLPLHAFIANSGCAKCHERQWEEFGGSMHSVSHSDPLYRGMAELARREAGEETYAYCAGCHSPQGVATGFIPATPESELPKIMKAGILCDVCHQVSDLIGPSGPWGEPGNASFVLSPDTERKFGPPGGDDDAATHTVETRDFFATSEFCASCHTVIHPTNGLRIEHTYEEWRNSVYAEKGIQCQDCHMRSVEDSIQVAERMEPVKVTGKSVPDGADRGIFLHTFVGGSADADRLSRSPVHAAIAEARLRSAARMEIAAPASASPGRALAFQVTVRNVGAGHNLPTSLTELREMWVRLLVRGPDGRVLFSPGGLDSNGDIEKGVMRFGALAGDGEGKVTHKPWEIRQFLWKRLIPPKGSETDDFTFDLPAGFSGPLRIEAVLYYRAAPPKVVRALLGEEAFDFKTTEMASAEAVVTVE